MKKRYEAKIHGYDKEDVKLNKSIMMDKIMKVRSEYGYDIVFTSFNLDGREDVIQIECNDSIIDMIRYETDYHWRES